MVLLEVMLVLLVLVVMLVVVGVLAVEELLLFMQEHTPTMDLLRVVVVLLVKVVLTLKEVVELLLDPRWNVNKDLQDNDGHTALMWAIMEGNEEVVELLLKRGLLPAGGDAGPLGLAALRRRHAELFELVEQRERAGWRGRGGAS